MHLFAKNHAEFDDCCFEAQKFDDNYGMLHSNSSQNSSKAEEKSKNIDFNALVDLIV